MSTPSVSPTQVPIRPEWLALTQETPIEPELAVVDAHHHLYHRPHLRYLLDEYLADLSGGHRVRASVVVQARSMLRVDAPAELQPIGETEFTNGMAAMSASGQYGETRVAAAIVGQANLLLGDAVRPILERHIAVAGGTVRQGGRFRGIRHPVAWDPDPYFVNPVYACAEGTLDSAAFRTGMTHLAELDLSFDAWLFFHQIPRLTALARAHPQVPMVLNHCGGILGIAGYAGRQNEVFSRWCIYIRELATCPNVMVKLSGLGMRLGGFGFEDRARAPGSVELAEGWRPWIETCIEAFGPHRCMYGSNFPVDKGSYAFTIGVNALKRLISGASADEKADILVGSAERFYRINDPQPTMEATP
jgi:L-fuconolactonase